jgi:PAS domain-containing protein
LTFQTADMVAKLAILARQSQEKVGKASDPIARAALEQLSTAVEELRVANEQLQIHVDQLSAVEREVVGGRAAVEEFADAVPVATLWTDEAQQIWRVNEAAARFLNTTKEDLLGKSLWSFVVDRDVLAGAMESLGDPVGRASVDVRVRVNPLDHRPRAIRLYGERLTTSAGDVWFL